MKTNSARIGVACNEEATQTLRQLRQNVARLDVSGRKVKLLRMWSGACSRVALKCTGSTQWKVQAVRVF